LPYVSDPAISRHIAAFLESTGEKPDAILFNGGFFIPEICRTRVADILETWYGRRPEIFENRDLDLAVASGAAYYSYVRSTGSGVLVRGGLPRAYYVGLTDSSAVCLVPRGAEEGDTVEVDRDDLQLVANKPVAFRLLSSLTRTDDKPGEVVEFTETEEIHQHAPLEAVIRYGKGGERACARDVRGCNHCSRRASFASRDGARAGPQFMAGGCGAAVGGRVPRTDRQS
jgi:hypothetical protein